MVWHYQVMKRSYKEYGEVIYAIHEYYPSDTDTKGSWTEDEIGPYSESLEGLKDDLKYMLDCIDKYGVRDYATGELIKS